MTEHQYPPHVIAAALADEDQPDDARVIVELEYEFGGREVTYATVDGYGDPEREEPVPWPDVSTWAVHQTPRIIGMFRAAPVPTPEPPKRRSLRHLVAFTVDGKPIPKKRARVTKNGNFTPEETTVYQDTIRWHALAAIKRAKRKPGPKDTRVMLAILFEFTGTAPSDIDNVVKSVMDALQPKRRGMAPVAYHDDRQVKELRVQTREHCERAATTVGVYEILEA